MRVVDILKKKNQPVISFEFFPPRNEKAAEKFEQVIKELSVLGPDFVSVTFGAGGSTREGSYQLVKKLKQSRQLEVVAYLAGYGLGPEEITSVLDAYRDLGIETIFAIRGDAPKEDEGFIPHPQSPAHASDLLAIIRAGYDFCLGAAAYPEGHLESESKEKDLEYLKLKVDQGAEYLVTQYFYDNRFYFDFIDRCRKMGISVPIIPGIMPIYSVKMMEMLASLCGATITREIRDGLAALPPDDKAAVAAFGVELATRQCRELLDWGVQGLHFYTMNRSESVVEIIKRLRNDQKGS
jgi:methylenetetrahydrofolate reductase (NADPH)